MNVQKSLLRLLGCVFIAGMTIFTGCKKETSGSNPSQQKNFAELSANSNIESFSVFDDVYNNVMGVNDEVAYGQTGVFGRIITVDSLVNPGFTVYVTRLNFPQPFPVKVLVDFGTGCMGKDSIIRKGKISIIYSGPLTLAGNVAETTFENFYRNDTRVEGSQRIENASTTQQLIFKVTVTDGKLTKSNGNYSLWNSINTISQIDGSSTPRWAKDDVLSIMGNANGTFKNDSAFLIWNSKIEEALIKKFTCPWIVKGKIEILQSNTDAAIIDYGNGDCNNKASLIINGLSAEITLH